MTVLVTGGGGFIGSHLVDHFLEETTDDIRVLDDFSTGKRANLAHIDDDRLTIVHGDVRDAETVREVAKGADEIYHLAAAVGVQKVVDEPLDSLRTNLQGTEHVLDAALAEDAATYIASSSEVYGKSDSYPFTERDNRVIGPSDVPRWGYATAKAVDEFLGLAYHDEHDLPVVVGRYFNIVGPRQVGEYGMVVPTFVEQALAEDPLTVYDDGTQRRSFTHVADAVRATYELVHTPAAHGEVFNVGSPDPTAINHLAERVLEHTGTDAPIIHVPLEEVYGEDFEEPECRDADVSKLRETLGWAPEMDLDRILEDVVAEYRGTLKSGVSR
jgi:UDP-glucose 4-epimerase